MYHIFIPFQGMYLQRMESIWREEGVFHFVWYFAVSEHVTEVTGVEAMKARKV